MIKHCDISYKEISPKQARYVLGLLKIPREFRHTIIREMIDYGLIVRVNQQSLFLNDCGYTYKGSLSMLEVE